MTFQKGDRVKHKLSGEAMEIRTIKEGVATCWQIEQEKQWGYSQGEKVLQYPLCVCLVKNLESMDKEQLKLL